LPINPLTWYTGVMFYLKIILYYFFVCCALLSHGVLAEQNNITLSLDDADITDLIRWASEITGKNIILHPNIQGKVTVLARQPMDQDEAYQVFLSTLQVHGLTVIEENGSLKVIPNAQAKESAIPLVGNNPENASEDIVVQIVKVKNISALDLTNLVRPLIPQSGYLAAYPQTNTLIIADRANNIQKILSLIDRIDQAGTVEIELIPIQFANANAIISVLGKVLPGQGNGQEGNGEFKLAVDERSNSILMTGDPVTRNQVKALIQRLDKALDSSGNTQVIRVQYANAADLVPLLQTVSGSVQKGAKSQHVADVEISIQAHEQLNALVITAPANVLSAMRGVISTLDVPRAQVLVEALIVEVSEDIARNIGVEWQTNQPGSGEAVFGGFSNFPPDVNPLSVQNGIATLGTGLSLGYFRGGSLRGIINALSGETNANILSTPTIVSLDNEEAEILVGSNVPFITGSQQRAGDIDPFQTIQRQDIGVTLKVKPRVNNDNSVTLEIEQTVESIAPTTASTADIVTNKREIKTRVSINNNEVLVLGGLMRDELTNGENRVPVLGKIPVLGHLFKSKSVKATKTNLMVFIHPRILQTGDSFDNLSHEKYNSIRNRQLEFNHAIDQFWLPGNTPTLPALEETAPSNAEE